MTVSEAKRQCLALVLILLNVCLALAGVCVFGIAIYVKEAAAKYAYFIVTYYNNAFHKMMFATGVLLIVIQSVGARLFCVCRTATSRSKITFPVVLYMFLGES